MTWAPIPMLGLGRTIYPARIAVRGSSMGGYFAIHALRRWPELACGVALNPPDEAGLNRLMRDARDPTTFFGEWRARGEGFPRLMGCDLACWLEFFSRRRCEAGFR